MSSFIGKVLSLPYCAGHGLINPGNLKVENRHIWESSREPYLVVFWKKYILQLKNIVFNNKKSKLIIRMVLLPLMPFFLCSKQNFIRKKNNYVSSFSFSTEIRHVVFFFKSDLSSLCLYESVQRRLKKGFEIFHIFHITSFESMD